MKFCTRYSPPSHDGVDFKDSPSLVHAEFKKDCDINEMVRRALCGDMSVIRHPDFSDISNLPEDSHELANLIAEANTAWHDLPDKVRMTFGTLENFISYFENADKQKAASLKEDVPTSPNDSASTNEQEMGNL